MNATRTSYDAVSDEYVRHIYDELRHKPLDRELLGRLARNAGDGLICDMGCGPGHVARYLHEQGARVCGIDLSDAMVERARQLNPGIEFRQGDMTALDLPDDSFAGMAAFYSLIHFTQSELVPVLKELRRVLRPGGSFLTGFHAGDDTLHLEDWWGCPVSVDFYFHPPATIAGHLTSAGFEIEEIVERDPYPEVEHPSRRAYIFARRPEA